MRRRYSLSLAVFVAMLAAAPVARSIDSPDFRTLIDDIRAIDNPNIRPLLAKAFAAEAAFMRGNLCAADGALGALQHHLEARFIDNPDFIDDPNIRLVIGDIAAIRQFFPPDPCIDNPNI